MGKAIPLVGHVSAGQEGLEHVFWSFWVAGLLCCLVEGGCGGFPGTVNYEAP